MKRVDFLGPSGVGKSYILRYLKKNRNYFKEWYTESEAVRHIPFKKLHYLPFTRSVSRIIKNEEKKAFKNCYREWIDFYTVCRLGLDNYGVKSKNYFRSVDKLLKTSKKVRLLENVSKKKVVFEQSLAQKVYFICGSGYQNVEIDLIKNFFTYMPRPSLLVVFKGSDKDIYNRVNKRRIETGRNGIEYGSIDGDELLSKIKKFTEWSEIAMNIFQENGDNVLLLDTSEQLEVNCDAFFDAVNKI